MSDETSDSGVIRHVIQEPHGGTAGVGVAYIPNAPPHETPYRIEQLWSDGQADPVYVGDRDDVLELIAALAEVL